MPQPSIDTSVDAADTRCLRHKQALGPEARHDLQVACVERFAVCREAQVRRFGLFAEPVIGCQGPRRKTDAGAFFETRIETEAEQGDRREGVA